ncbi:hypothetical protein BBO99_00007302 [Phytophthora kernoviae]|uniref:Uncharacterized protein n=1 Tax=Phytophthora kernoviae TaxID=325452 RepID=A0A421GIM2_9STRA|nr:hypothetical protein JM16_006969 [Phytophthora kernoviae]KAG2517231.1 hypothetical protein JM18_007099 [Phytophthora kernoviae]RLN43887.1 hypothetical protein BBI17_008327 [Phytophthora kernoviae]RLN76756.1 hypothetical protein BBO99_00007302 [Phytophthora kernoviae]
MTLDTLSSSSPALPAASETSTQSSKPVKKGRGAGKRLTDRERLEILEIFDKNGGAVSNAEVARRYGITRAAIQKLKLKGPEVRARYRHGSAESRDGRKRGSHVVSVPFEEELFEWVKGLKAHARDLWYKTQWLGPSDAFAYSTKSSVRLVDTWSEKTVADSLTGWRAFHATCSELRVLTGSGKIADGRPHFLYVLAANCSGPDGLTEDMEPQLESMVLKSDVRADAMAWAACKLLYISRRPPLCQDAMVTGFIHKYRLGAPRVTSAMMAAPMSEAERELRALLDVIAKSWSLSMVVCVSGVELPSIEQQKEVPLRRIFGCGSPNLPGKSAAFVGQYATAFADLQIDKVRLTMDDIDILGMRFIFRQNAVRNYIYHPPTPVGSVQERQSSFHGHMDVHTALNLSCSGFLYNVMVFVDVVLLVLHAWSASELLKRLILSSLLLELLLLSLVIAGLGMTARYLLHNHRLHMAENTVPTVEDVDGIMDDTHLTTSRPSTVGFSMAQAIIAGYKRLPLEELLDVPIRAKHIVRSGGDGGLEKTVNEDQFLWTVQCLSHGVLLENDRFLSTRCGFFRVLPMIEPVDASVWPSDSESTG